jgi:CHAT domain-containing protein/tetratricopeptide (TPR) repeat protein
VKDYLIHALWFCLLAGSKILLAQNVEAGILAYDRGVDYYLQSNYDSAEYFFQYALPIYRKANKDTLLGDCYHNLGTTYLKKKSYQKALDFTRKGLRTREKIYGAESLSTAVVGISYRALGNIHLDQGNYDSTIYYYEIAESIFQKDTATSAETQAILLSNLGSLYQEKGQYEKSVDYHLKSLEIHLELLGEGSFKVAGNYNNLANAYSDMGEHDLAMNYYRKALKIKQKVLDSDHPSLASSYNNLGSAYQLFGQDQLALENYEQALEIRRKAFPENHPYLGRSYYNIASIYLNLEENEKALQAFTRATNIWLESLGEQNPYTAMGFHGMGMAQIELKQFAAALINTRKSLDISVEILGKEHPSVIQTYQTLGQAYLSSGNDQKALELYLESVELQTELFSPTHSFIATIFKNIGDVYLNKNQLDQAEYYFLEAAKIEVSNFGNNHPDLAETYLNLATIYSKQDMCQDAESYFQKAFAANVKGFSDGSPEGLPVAGAEALNYTTLLETYLARAKALEVCKPENQLPQLINLYERAILTLDFMISSYRSEEGLIALKAKFRNIYENAIEVMLMAYEAEQNEKYLEQALLYAEKGKASRFNQLFRASYATNMTVIPKVLLELEQSLGKKLVFYEGERLQAGIKRDTSTLKRLEANLFALDRAYDSLMKVIQKDYPDYHQIVYSPAVADRKSIEKVLPEGSGFLEYFLGDEHLYTFYLDGKTISAVRLPLPDLAQVETFRESLYGYYLQNDTVIATNTAPGFKQEWQTLAPHFYQTLLVRAIPNLPKRLVVVPDGYLGYLPFEIFMNEDHQYLIQKSAVSYAYSATHFCQLFERNRRRRVPDNKLLTFAPEFTQPQTTYADAEWLRRDYLGPLVYSEKEVKVIQEIMGGQILMGANATKDTFLSVADTYQIIHLSSHGKVNDENPRFSYIAFASENDSVVSETNTYYQVSGLYLADLYNLDLNADMVVLSACETGLGKLAKAEGIISLARGFAFAGASSIITTLWSVNDKTSADLMTLFYENLSQGMPKDVAMQQAKLAFVDENEAPFYWAGFIVIGDPGPLEDQNRWWIYWLAGGGIIVLIGLGKKFSGKRV